MRASPHVQRSLCARLSSSTPVVAGYEWVRDNIMKYKYSLTSMKSVDALQRQDKLANTEDFCKLIIQACRSDNFSFLRVVPGRSPFFFMYEVSRVSNKRP